jgi:disulfide bond formation protein DsbB
MSLERRLFYFVFAMTVCSLLAALISQHLFDMYPCAWCVLQRLILVVIGALALLGIIGFRLRWFRRLMLFMVVAASTTGAWAAWHQMTVAAKLFSCDQTLADRIMTSTGLEASVPWLFGIYATCMDASVSVLGMDYAAWALTLFVVLTLSALLALWASYRWPRTRG